MLIREAVKFRLVDYVAMKCFVKLKANFTKRGSLRGMKS